MFWGLTLKPGKHHTQVFTEEILVSMATLESRKDFGETPDNYSHVVVKTQASDYLLCTLVHGLQFQQNLNLKLMPKEKITFRVQGTSKVYLTGFTPSCPVEDVDLDQGEEEEENVSQRATTEEQKSDDQEDAGWLVDDCENTDDIIEDVIEALSGEELNRPEDQSEESDGASANDGEGEGGKDDNFLSVAELSNLPVKQEGIEEPQPENHTPAGGMMKNAGTTSLASAATDNMDEDGSSLEGSEDEWILDEGENDAVDEVGLSGADDEDGSGADSQQVVILSCDVCNQQFGTKEEKAKHEENDHRLPAVPSQLRRADLSSVKQAGKYKCKYCSKMLANKSSKKKHEAVHARERKLFQCKYCPKIFSYRQNLVRHGKLHRHEKLHKPSMLYRCLICNEGFQQIQIRDKHVLGHFKKDTQRCDLCRQVTCKGECMPTEQIMNSQIKTTGKQETPQAEVRYKCSHCPKIFQLKGSRSRHEKIHSGESTNPSPSQTTEKPEKLPQTDQSETKECKYCYKAFQSDAQCKNHERTHTGEERPFLCRCCKKTFLDHVGRRKHELRHPEMRKFSCKFCHKRFSKQNLCCIHESQHLEEKPFKCRHCERCFSNKGNRVKHEIIHKMGGAVDVPPAVANADSTKGNPSQSQPASFAQTLTKVAHFPCRICGKKFASSSGRSRHQNLHGGLSMKKVAVLTCTDCDTTFINRTQLSEHECNRDDKEFLDTETSATSQHKHKGSPSSSADTVCRYCKKEFASRNSCVIHQRLHTGEKPCCCNVCDFKTNDPSSLNKHMKKHKSRPFKCSYCPSRFMSHYSLQLHETQHRTAKAIHNCMECEKLFTSKKELDFHRQVHTEPSSFRPYRCTYCSKTFAAPESLKRHEHIHEKEQPFKCIKCGRHFKTSIGLQKHSLICTDGKPNKCRYCSKGFSSSKGCHMHEESHIVSRPFKCSRCDRGFLSTHSREMHEKTHTL